MSRCCKTNDNSVYVDLSVFNLQESPTWIYPPLHLPLCRYAGIFWHPLGHVLCLHQRLVADQRASAAGLHRRGPAVRQEAPGDGMRPQHPRQPGPHGPALSRRPGQRGHLSPAAQVRRRPAGDGLPRKHGAASVWARGHHPVPGVQRAEDWHLVRRLMITHKSLQLPVLLPLD